MPLVLISDTHLAAPAKSPVDAAGRNRYLLEIVKCLDVALDEAVAVGGEIVHGGDFFHDRKGVRPEALEAAGRWLERCKAKKIKVHLLVGNHDLSDGADGSASISALAGFANIISEPVVHEIQGMKVAFMPYTHGKDHAVATVEKLRGNLLVGHLGLGDPRFADCVPADYEAPGAITLSDLNPSAWEQIFLGHYHNRQSMTGRAHYIGSPLQLSLKEAGQERGILVYDPKKSGVNKIRKIVNTWSPKYLKVQAAEALDLVRKGTTDFVVAVDADSAEAAELAKAVKDTAVSLRVERKAKEATEARLPSDTKEGGIVTAYVDLVTKGMSADEKMELSKIGNDILSRASRGD